MSTDLPRAPRGIVDALKGQPLLLAMVLMNFALLGYLYYTGVVAHNERQQQTELMYENRSEMAKLLAECGTRP